MRASAADGRLTTGAAAAESLNGGPTGEGLPVLFLGSSRGTMASGWAMAMNFDRSCTYDEPELTCREAKIGRASCRERVWKYVSIAVYAVSLKKKEKNNKK